MLFYLKLILHFTCKGHPVNEVQCLRYLQGLVRTSHPLNKDGERSVCSFSLDGLCSQILLYFKRFFKSFYKFNWICWKYFQIKHEVEIARLKKDLREKDNVVEEKMEELAEMTDKVELLETVSVLLALEDEYHLKSLLL